MEKKITPRNEDYSKWYNDIVSEAGLAESSDVRGCMITQSGTMILFQKLA